MMIFAILVFTGFAVIYVLAIGKVWRGTSHIDTERPPSWWPFSVALWRGISRAFPVQGACVLVLIAGGGVADAIGKDGAGYDIAMSAGLVGLLGIFVFALPIMFYNRPRFLVPPHQRDDPGAIAEWRTARARR